MTYQVNYAQAKNHLTQFFRGEQSGIGMLTYAQLKQLPKVELHRHLEGSLRLETLVETAKRFNMDVPQEIELLRPHVQVTNEPPDAHTFLAKFEMLRRFYRTPETVRRLAYEVVADAARDNVRYLELRFSPQALSRYQGVPLGEACDWVIDAINEASRHFQIEVKLIVTLVRHDPIDQARKVAETAFERRDKGIVGLDLAGDEINHPSLPFQDIFAEAKQLGMSVTIHAGEWRGAEAVRTAIINLGADRIGHGVRAIDDPNIMSLVRERSTALEICLTSNMQTASIMRLKDHPIRSFLKAGLPVTLNTDDPTISNITLTDEYYLATERLGFDYRQLRHMTLTAIDSAFVNQADKQRLRSYFETQWPIMGDNSNGHYLNGNHRLN